MTTDLWAAGPDRSKAVEAALGENCANLTSEDATQHIRRFAELMSELQATDDACLRDDHRAMDC